MNISNQILALISLLIGYIVGSFPSGYLAGKWVKGIDLRTIGSGSTGATNVLRHIGKTPALIVLLIDVFKGVLPILIARKLLLNDSWQVASGIAALLGHIWPIWLQWKGGKAVATGLGLFLGLSWKVGLSSLGIFLTVLSFSKIVSLSSVSAAICLPILMFLNFHGEPQIPTAYISVSMLSMVIVIWRHRSNIKRLLKGEEPKIGKSN